MGGQGRNDLIAQAEDGTCAENGSLGFSVGFEFPDRRAKKQREELLALCATRLHNGGSEQEASVGENDRFRPDSQAQMPGPVSREEKQTPRARDL